MNFDFYRAIAPCYDRLGDHLDFNKYAAKAKEACEKYGECNNKIALDLACGTGSLAIELAKLGFDVIGADSCSDMLSEARAKAEEAGEKILFVEQDMRAIDLFGTVGLVVCATDSLNHLLSVCDLERCINSASKFLESGGIMLFDVNGKDYFERVCEGRDWILEDEGALCCVSCDYPAGSGGAFCDYYLSLFVEREDGAYDRTDAYQRERVWSKRTIEKVLAGAGIEIKEEIPFCENQSGRTLYICKKN